MSRNLFLLVCLSGVLPLSAAPTCWASEPSFTRDVMAVLSKSGCNLGACHGNQNGKAGFKLSLRGQDPVLDHEWLTREYGSRRVNRFAPQASLILQKPSGGLAHQGGVRFSRDSWEYRILSDWIAAGAPEPNATESKLVRLEVSPTEAVLVEPTDKIYLQVNAHFADGTQRDVTHSACYETSNLSAAVSPSGCVQRLALGETTVLVRYLDKQAAVRLAFIAARPTFAWANPAENNYIDRHLFERLKMLRMNPSPPSEDRVFIRRAHLDALGVLPTAEEARAFVADERLDKRDRLIDALLARPEFAEHWTLKWSDVLRNEEKVLDPKGVEIFHAWIRDGIAAEKPVNQFVRELVASRGDTFESPAANFYRANRDPLTRGETAARLFLGVRLGCAKCHNHPFEHWTQDDYYSWAALFARVDYKVGENKRNDKLDKNEFKGEQTVLIKDEGEVKNDRTGQNAVPKFLGVTTQPFEAPADRLEPLSRWLTDASNRQFARTQVNFIWYHVFGRGLVEPIDDFRATNPASNPPLLEALTSDFIAHDFSLRHAVRSMMTSRAYQLAAEPNDTNRDDETNFSRALVKRLTAEKLLDAQMCVLDTAAEFAGQNGPLRAGAMAGAHKISARDKKSSDGDRFLATFGKPERLLACECERSNETTLAQAFVLIGGESLNVRLAEPGNRLDRLAKSNLPPAEIVGELYWTALARPPLEEELSAAVNLLGNSSDRFTALQDLAWALLNAKEFVFRR